MKPAKKVTQREKRNKKDSALNDRVLESISPDTLQDLEEEHLLEGVESEHSELEYDEYEHPEDYDKNAYDLSIDSSGNPREVNFDRRQAPKPNPSLDHS